MERLAAGPCRTIYENRLTQITDGANTNLYGVDRIAKYAGGAANYYYADALGSVREMWNGSGTLNHTYDYKAFGDILSQTGSGSSFRYTGQQADDESGLYYLRARYYDPLTGRFLTKDPVEGADTSPITQNPYVYARNNPLGLTDPSGEFAWVPILVGGLIGGVSSLATYWATNGSSGNWGDAAKSTAAGFGGGMLGSGVMAIKAVGSLATVARTLIAGASNSGTTYTLQTALTGQRWSAGSFNTSMVYGAPSNWLGDKAGNAAGRVFSKNWGPTAGKWAGTGASSAVGTGTEYGLNRFFPY